MRQRTATVITLTLTLAVLLLCVPVIALAIPLTFSCTNKNLKIQAQEGWSDSGTMHAVPSELRIDMQARHITCIYPVNGVRMGIQKSIPSGYTSCTAPSNLSTTCVGIQKGK
jgi:hypothetical protein